MGDPRRQPARGQNSRRTRAFVSWSIVVGSILTVGALSVLAVGLGMYLHTVFANPADTAIKPFAAALEKDGGKRVCGAGDAGLGPDNRVPWATVYYLVPDGADIAGDLRTTADAEGYALQPETFEAEPEPMPDEALSAGGRLEVWVYRDVDVPLDCYDTVAWGDTRRADGNAAIVKVMMLLPSRPVR